MVIAQIDLGDEERAVAARIDAACRELGFFTIVGHGVDPAVGDAAWTLGKELLTGPPEIRAAVAMPEPGYPYGYSAYAGETLASSLGQTTPPDLKSSFSIGPIDESPRAADGSPWWGVDAPNLWPPVAGFRDAWEGYYRAMSDLAGRLMRLFALGLGLPADHFVPFFEHHGSALRMIHYPDVRGAVPGQLRAGAHTDYGTLTILRTDDAPGGLEVALPDGTWSAVPYVAESFVINIGDLMQRWTNDRWRSTMHRVVLPPPDARGSTERFSMPFFHNASPDALIECLPTCLAPGERPHHPPVRAGEHLMEKFRAAMAASS